MRPWNFGYIAYVPVEFKIRWVPNENNGGTCFVGSEWEWNGEVLCLMIQVMWGVNFNFFQEHEANRTTKTIEAPWG